MLLFYVCLFEEGFPCCLLVFNSVALDLLSTLTMEYVMNAQVAAFSLVTNLAAGMTGQELTHDEVGMTIIT